MRVAVARETRPGETRVALVPARVGRLVELGCTVHVEPGSGAPAGHPDPAYVAAGARVHPDALDGADLVVSVRPPDLDRAARLRPGAVACFLPVPDPSVAAALRDAGVSALALELVPRTARAQPLDALTSQSLVAGLRAAVVVQDLLSTVVPLTVTAAGTLGPARVLVLGTGVAGLQAVASLRRAGAHVEAHDVRPASAEEIRSVGGVPLDLGLEPLTGEAAALRETTPERAARQRTLLAPHVARADAVVTAAVLPGRTPPLLVDRAAVEAMAPGSVVVDLAAELGGNVEGSQAGRVVRVGAARVWGGRDVAAQLPAAASALLAGHVVALVEELRRTGGARPDDELLGPAWVTHGGWVVHRPTRQALDGVGP